MSQRLRISQDENSNDQLNFAMCALVALPLSIVFVYWCHSILCMLIAKCGEMRKPPSEMRKPHAKRKQPGDPPKKLPFVPGVLSGTTEETAPTTTALLTGDNTHSDGKSLYDRDRDRDEERFGSKVDPTYWDLGKWSKRSMSRP